MEEIRVTFENDGMQCEVSMTAEHYVQAVYALIEQGFEHFGELDRFFLLGAVYKAIQRADEYGNAEIYS